MDTTDTEIIDRLGGTKAVAELCGLTQGAISQWRRNGIPAGWHRYLTTLVADRANSRDEIAALQD